jgi:hypothetical protein
MEDVELLEHSRELVLHLERRFADAVLFRTPHAMALDVTAAVRLEPDAEAPEGLVRNEQQVVAAGGQIGTGRFRLSGAPEEEERTGDCCSVHVARRYRVSRPTTFRPTSVGPSCQVRPSGRGR